MGHPKKKRRKYSVPKHPWQSGRLEKEKGILENYSLKNKKEIWKMQSILKKFTNQAKRLANTKTAQAKKEKEQMTVKLFRLGLMKKNGEIDDVLGLRIEDILDRRLQSLVYKKGLSNTMKQARQFVIHGHIFIGDKKVSVSSYLVKSDEEDKIGFKEGSKLTGKFGRNEEEENKKTKKKEVKKEETKKEIKKEETKKEVKKEEVKKEKPKKEEDGV